VITLLLVGDVMLGRLVAERARQAHVSYPFERTASVLGKGNVVFGNLECPLSERGTPNERKSPELLLRGGTHLALRLKAAGFTALSLANNHMFDYGVDAFRDTVAALDRAEVRHVGAGLNECEAREPLVLDVDGRPLETVILALRLSAKRLEAWRPIPVRIASDFQPQLADGDEGAVILSRLTQISAPLYDSGYPIWEEMAWLERKLRELSLGKIAIWDVIRYVGKLRLHHLRWVPLYLKTKLSGLLQEIGRGK
jgi:hypothetical protein